MALENTARMSNQSDTAGEVRQLFRNIFTSKSINEPIFVSIDVTHGNSKGAFNAIGASVLDIRHFKRWIATVEDQDQPLFWTYTYNFLYGPSGVVRTQKRSLFDGDAQKVSKCERLAVLRHIFSYPEEEESAKEGELRCFRSREFRPLQCSKAAVSLGKVEEQGRPIIVVGHALNCDIRSLRKADFSIADVAPVLAFLDTQTIARELYWKDDVSRNPSLKKLCILMGFQPAKLHICGNDAGYTLVVLLCLARKIFGNEQEGEDADTDAEIRRVLEQLVQIGLASAKTARQKRKELVRKDRQDSQKVDDWAEHLDGLEGFL